MFRNHSGGLQPLASTDLIVQNILDRININAEYVILPFNTLPRYCVNFGQREALILQQCSPLTMNEPRLKKTHILG